MRQRRNAVNQGSLLVAKCKDGRKVSNVNGGKKENAVVIAILAI